MSIRLDPKVTPTKYEELWYKFWMKNQFFTAQLEDNAPTYTILMPPPNVTDRLHMGHGLNNTLQDILIRWKKMQGYNCCWLPGTDHAGIATQMMVEKFLLKQGKTKEDIGRDDFLQECQRWKNKHGDIIVEQLKRLGVAADWSRQAYTMNSELSYSVRHIFVKLYERGLIYRGERLINWDPLLKTAISDDEVSNIEQQGHLWTFVYPIVGGEEQIPIATTRPETMFGDVAVAVHPDDERYKPFIGQSVKVPLINRKIPIIADSYVKMDFGTGCVKITPAHDFNDFIVAKRHHLPLVNVMEENGRLNQEAPQSYRGLDHLEARQRVVLELKSLGFFVEEKTHVLSLPISERSKSVVEPRLSKQWFVKMKPLVVDAIRAAKKGDLSFYPVSWKKTYLHWLENVEDWCISRQLWWGHRIPVWTCCHCEHILVSVDTPEKCSQCQQKNLKQDPDVLDTWFSSWLWPLSPFGWPNQTKDLEKFFPSQVLITGGEIVFLWVARMIIASFEMEKTLPFSDICFNTILCDKQGRKFSKTLGNGIDPMDTIREYGADATRFTCVNLAPIGGRIKMAKEDFHVGSKFVNKLWNAARFILAAVDNKNSLQSFYSLSLSDSDNWLYNRFFYAVQGINKHLKKYRFHEAISELYHFIWNDFCDWGLEIAKSDLYGEDPRLQEEECSKLLFFLEGILRLTHPILPFVTEEIWQKLPKSPDWDRPKSLMIASYPTTKLLIKPKASANLWETIKLFISAVRSIRTQATISQKTLIEVYVATDEPSIQTFLLKEKRLLSRLAKISSLFFLPRTEMKKQSFVHISSFYTIYVPVSKFVDLSKESSKLSQEEKRLNKLLANLQKKLSNNDFCTRAPEKVIKTSREQYANLSHQLLQIKENLKSFNAK